jgi:hypothetical protein
MLFLLRYPTTRNYTIRDLQAAIFLLQLWQLLQRRENMLGLHDFWIILVYLLCIGSTLLCVVYGLVNWNRGGDGVQPEKILRWEKEEEELTE